MSVADDADPCREERGQRTAGASTPAARRASFQDLARPHVPSLHALATRVLGGHGAAADEVVQDALLRAWRAFDELREAGAARSWLLRITWNVARSWRGRRAAEPVGLGSVEVPAGLDADPGVPVLERELRERLLEALERLPERQRAALHLRAWEGMDYASIAAALDCSSGAARMLVLEARRRLRSRLGEELEP